MNESYPSPVALSEAGVRKVRRTVRLMPVAMAIACAGVVLSVLALLR